MCEPEVAAGVVALEVQFGGVDSHEICVFTSVITVTNLSRLT